MATPVKFWVNQARQGKDRVNSISGLIKSGISLIIRSNSNPENDRTGIAADHAESPVTFSDLSGSLAVGFSLLCDNPTLSNPQNPAEAACSQHVLIRLIAVCASTRVGP